jgi:ketol-acid reductoisomerase
MNQRYTEQEEYLAFLRGKTVAILGYSPEGKEEALFLREKGIDVIIGIRPIDTELIELARKDGFEPLPLVEAVAKADISQVW